MRILALIAACAALCAGAVDSTQWPPKSDAAARMRELQLVIGSPESTAAQRESAREELSSLLKSPNAKGRTPDEKPLAPRAAIEPLGPIVKRAVNPSIPVPGVATVDVTIAPRITVAPRTGSAVAPAGPAAIHPRTGHGRHDACQG